MWINFTRWRILRPNWAIQHQTMATAKTTTATRRSNRGNARWHELMIEVDKVRTTCWQIANKQQICSGLSSSQIMHRTHKTLSDWNPLNEVTPQFCFFFLSFFLPFTLSIPMVYVAVLSAQWLWWQSKCPKTTTTTSKRSDFVNEMKMCASWNCQFIFGCVLFDFLTKCIFALTHYTLHKAKNDSTDTYTYK